MVTPNSLFTHYYRQNILFIVFYDGQMCIKLSCFVVMIFFPLLNLWKDNYFFISREHYFMSKAIQYIHYFNN